MPARTGFVAALATEAAIVRKAGARIVFDARRGGSAAAPDREALSPAKGEGLPPLLAITGAGRQDLERAVEALHRAGASRIVSFGVAGGLDPALLPGTIVLPTIVEDAKGRRYGTDEAWRVALWRRVAGSSGLIIESGAPIHAPRGKAELFRATGASAVDMESAGIAEACASRGLPFVAVRSIADAAGMRLPAVAIEGTDRFGRVRPCRFAIGVVRRPADLGALLSLGRAFKAACGALRSSFRSIVETD